jgi:hypothetical protein
VTKPGTRVWAVRNADQETVWAFGPGTYVGDMPRPGGDGTTRAMAEKVIRDCDQDPRFDPRSWILQRFADGKISREEHDRELVEAAERVAADRARPMPDRVDEFLYQLSLNPKIVLDGGGVVWGCECWWGEADAATPLAWAKGRRIVTVPAPHPPDPELTTGEDGA